MKNQEMQNDINDQEADAQGRNSESTKSLLHELISLGQFKAIATLKELASTEQWEFLTGYKSFVMNADVRITDDDEDEAVDSEEEKKDEA